VRSEFIKNFKSPNALSEFAEQTEDAKMKTMIHLCNTHKGSLYFKIESLRKKAVKEKGAADISYATAHTSKGDEWDKVTILDDGFMSSIEDIVTSEVTHAQKKEEINLHFVAASRAKVILFNMNQVIGINENTVIQG
jgi:superfamily I DNA/RNA helicase